MTNIGIKALIVDDEVHIRRGIGASVPWRELEVTEVYEAEDGAGAIALYDEHAPDLVLLDINMPGINGLDVARHIRQRSSVSRIVFLTGYDDFPLVKEAVTLEATDYLLKPVSYEELLEALNRAIRQAAESRRRTGYVDDLKRQLTMSIQPSRLLEAPGGSGSNLLAKELYLLGELRAGREQLERLGALDEWLDELTGLPVPQARMIASQFVLNASRSCIEKGHELEEAQTFVSALSACEAHPAIEACVRDFFALLSEVQQMAKKKPGLNAIEQAQAWIRAHMGEDISLQSLAAALHLNPYYVSRLFKQETGETYGEFTTRIRFEKARELLSGSELKMHEIAAAVGYPDANYFSIAFKKQEGVSPTDYRKRFR
ncbi:response regulator [Cohnella sp. REN36]|uniref:response regulator n=1 Tax=Cohnella sp. REN36 TaxID=2887347 RepID=UPI001D153122|nr:response regulator [Cohnella sp. REN36]MCC3376317.1 response regulator [Cohnella sp. REN36]